MNRWIFTRRELLAAAIVGLSVHPAAAAPARTRWSKQAATKLRNEQERTYRSLGKRMGIGSDPMTVYRALINGRMPAKWISPDKFWNAVGSGARPGNGLGDPEAVIRDYVAEYGQIRVPTPYEDPNLYAVLLEMSDAIDAAMQSHGLGAPPRLLLGTLPTGTTNASQYLVRNTGEHIVIFERGLFGFVFQMSKIVAAVFPPIDPVRRGFAHAVNIERGVDANPKILDQLNRVLYAYLVSGDPQSVSPYPLDGAADMTASFLLRSMELFALGHEYGHFIVDHSGDLGPQASSDPATRQSWDDEYGADRVGVSLLIGVMDNVLLSFWGAVNMLVCLEVLDRARSILTTGTFDSKARSPTHPPNLQRSQQLRNVIREMRPGLETEQAIAVADQVDSFWSRIWQIAEPEWIALHNRGVSISKIWSQ